MAVPLSGADLAGAPPVRQYDTPQDQRDAGHSRKGKGFVTEENADHGSAERA